jgi:hypothetical protein
VQQGASIGPLSRLQGQQQQAQVRDCEYTRSFVRVSLTSLQSYGIEFHRAANILEHFRRSAASSGPLEKARRTERFRTYCDRFIEALREFEKEVKSEGGLEKYRHKRAASFEKNQRSYFKKIGVSSATHNNVVVQKDVEANLLVSLPNRERRLIFYGKGAA